MPLFASAFADDVGRYEVRIAGSASPGPRYDSLARALLVAGAACLRGVAVTIYPVGEPAPSLCAVGSKRSRAAYPLARSCRSSVAAERSDQSSSDRRV